MIWHQDPIFQDGIDDRNNLEVSSSPAFRLALVLPVYGLSIRSYFPVLSEIFECFKPSLQKHSERLLMIEVPDGSPRRRKTILDEDWEPFAHLNEVLPDDYADFSGFFFQSGHVEYGHERSDHIFDRGPSGFSYYCRGNIQVDATVSISDWEDGLLDIERLKKALLKLKHGSAIAGFGLQRSMDVYGNYNDKKVFKVAKKYPLLNVQKTSNRGWIIGAEKNLKDIWIFGVNWITVVAEPFLSVLSENNRLIKLPISGFQTIFGESSVLFQIGDMPSANADDELLARYFSLGKILRPIGKGSPSKRRPGRTVFHKDKASLMWERRFYDGKWFEEFDV